MQDTNTPFEHIFNLSVRCDFIPTNEGGEKYDISVILSL